MKIIFNIYIKIFLVLKMYMEFYDLLNIIINIILYEL